jgi:hypothetical protein
VLFLETADKIMNFVWCTFYRVNFPAKKILKIYLTKSACIYL